MDYLILWLFKVLIIFSVFMVVHSANPIHSVLFLILVFCNSAGIVLLLKAEFLAMVFVVVYVGAIAVLFLFVVMMFDLRQTELQNFYISYLPIGCFIGLVVFFELLYVFYNDFFTNPYSLYFSSNVFNYE